MAGIQGRKNLRQTESGKSEVNKFLDRTDGYNEKELQIFGVLTERVEAVKKKLPNVKALLAMMISSRSNAKKHITKALQCSGQVAPSQIERFGLAQYALSCYRRSIKLATCPVLERIHGKTVSNYRQETDQWLYLRDSRYRKKKKRYRS